MVDLKARPYYLSEEDCQWVKDTIANMSPEEKVGQLFFQLTASHDEEYLKELMEKYHLVDAVTIRLRERRFRNRIGSFRNMQRFRYLSHATQKPEETAHVQMGHILELV